jgi:hypothetical protein
VASVSLQLWSVTGSLTILVAGFQWSDESAEALDHVAWTDYQTAVIPAKGGRSHYSPYMLKALEARRLRRIRHRRVAAWLTEKVPGLYHELGSPLPALDVITLAQGRPYCEDPPLKTYDYREALGLEGGVEVAASASMPGWKLGLHSSELPTVLTLGARTAEVFDDRVLKYHGEVSRSAMSSFLDRRAASLLCSWAATLVIPTLHEQLVRVRDRAPVRRESSVSFARRLSHDTTVALRHGVDSAAFCDDVLNRPAEAGPARVLRTVDFVVEYPPYRGGLLGERWVKWIAQEAEAMRRVERGQRERLATEAQLTGLVVDIRTQVQMRRLTIAAVAFSVIAVVVAVLQLLLAD